MQKRIQKRLTREDSHIWVAWHHHLPMSISPSHVRSHFLHHTTKCNLWKNYPSNALSPMLNIPYNPCDLRDMNHHHVTLRDFSDFSTIGSDRNFWNIAMNSGQDSCVATLRREMDTTNSHTRSGWKWNKQECTDAIALWRQIKHLSVMSASSGGKRLFFFSVILHTNVPGY